MLTKTAIGAQTALVIHPATRIGMVHLTVADLEKQIAFHQKVLGFKLHWRNGSQAGLGAGGEDLLRFTELKGARRAPKTTGLYHTAILVPSKRELAQLLRRITESQTPIQRTAERDTHLALYLPDTEGNGLELAWDFPREKWQPLMPSTMQRTSEPLDIEDLLHTLEDDEAPWTGLHPDTRVGHVHLHVADLAASRGFYHDVLGFDIISDQSDAVFFSAGGYHHHIATNVLHGVGAPPPPPDATGLRHFTVVVPDQAELQRVVDRVQQAGIASEPTPEGTLVHDPALNGMLLTAGA